ncbi:MAG: lamin tail domain-containing protein, partial [Verrucomicrobiota bacterium]
MKTPLQNSFVPSHSGWFILWVLFLGGFPARGQTPIISEFLAANTAGLEDEDGERHDWIEIFNPAPNPLNLDGWRLTDDASVPDKWVFPEVVIAPRNFLLVFASDKDRRDPGKELHANFKLNDEGEYLALVRPDGQPVSAFAPSFPTQVGDTSYGIELELDIETWATGQDEARLRVPTDGSLANRWIEETFDDSDWTRVTMGIGAIPEGPESPEPELTLIDATRPGDRIVGTSFNSPNGEEVEKAIDDRSSTKYLNFDKLSAGFSLTLSRGPTVVSGLRLTSANDAPERDPSRYELFGSTDGITYTEIASANLPLFVDRFQTIEQSFANSLPYAHYRLIFPTVRHEGSAVAMQIAEVELLALLPVVPAGEGDDVTQPGDPIEPTSFNSPLNEEVEKAIDDNPRTKYLNFDKLNAGFTVAPSTGPSVVTGLRLTSANDADNRDPTRFSLEGGNPGQDFTVIAEGAIPDFRNRFETVAVGFENEQSFSRYRLLFPEVRDAANAVAVQIGEVELIGTSGPSNLIGELVETDVSTELEQHPGAFVRIPFTIPEGTEIREPFLRTWFQHGFVASLNGFELAQSNMPANPGWDALALSERSAEESQAPERFDLSPFRDHLKVGQNLLAIHGAKPAPGDDSYLLRAEVGEERILSGSLAYFAMPTPGTWNGKGALGVLPPLEVSPERGFFELPFSLGLEAPDFEGVDIRYTTDGSQPTNDNGQLYSGSIRIDETTILRAAAFKEGWLPSPTL